MRLARASDRSIGQVAKDLDLTETALRGWVKQAEIDARKGPLEALTTAEREELVRLRRDNKPLQMERDILKSGGHLLREGERGIRPPNGVRKPSEIWLILPLSCPKLCDARIPTSPEGADGPG